MTHTREELAEYMAEIRKEVCSRCIERPPGGPPCAPHGKACGIEINLPQIIDAVHASYSGQMEPYTAAFHETVCPQCPARSTSQCPCPMEYLLILAVQAIEAVDHRHAEALGRISRSRKTAEQLQTACERVGALL